MFRNFKLSSYAISFILCNFARYNAIVKTFVIAACAVATLTKMITNMKHVERTEL